MTKNNFKEDNLNITKEGRKRKKKTVIKELVPKELPEQLFIELTT